MSWKAAKKPYTKAQKRQRAAIREEFEWVLKIPADKPNLIESFGGARWVGKLMELNNDYKQASDGRDELLNNSMLMLASLNVDLYRKMIDSPKSLTISELRLVWPFLKRAQQEAPSEN